MFFKAINPHFQWKYKHELLGLWKSWNDFRKRHSKIWFVFSFKKLIIVQSIDQGGGIDRARISNLKGQFRRLKPEQFFEILK